MRPAVLVSCLVLASYGCHEPLAPEPTVIVISGEVVGNVQAKHRVEIHRPAIFKGDILAPSLSVDEGVIFEGRSRMVKSPSDSLSNDAVPTTN